MIDVTGIPLSKDLAFFFKKTANKPNCRKIIRKCKGDFKKNNLFCSDNYMDNK